MEYIGILIAVASIGISVLAFAPMLLRLAKGKQVHNQLREHGVAAEATIVGLSRTGLSINDQPECLIQLQIAQPSGAPFMATAKQIIDTIEIPQYQPGSIVTVRYDPNNPTSALVVAFGSQSHLTQAEASQMIDQSQALLMELNQPGAGVRASAIVTEFKRSNVNVNGGNILAVLNVKVLPLGGQPFDTTITGAFGASGLHKYQAGQTVNVVCDPNDSRRCTFDMASTNVGQG